MRSALVLGLAAAAGGCHVRIHAESSGPGLVERFPRDAPPTAGPPTLVLADARLRFVEPLTCATDEYEIPHRTREVTTRPNLATFIVGVLATSAGAVLMLRSAGEDGAVNDFTLGGAAALAVGLPFAIGPWIGNGVAVTPAPTRREYRPGPAVPCGNRPFAARSATLALRGLEIRGAIDAAGAFAVSPYELVDAFDYATGATTDALDITATVDTAAGPRTVAAVLEPAALAASARAFLARPPSDPRPSDPRPPDPRPSDPRPSDPRPSDPRPSDPRPSDPRPSDPRPPDARPSDPRPSDPRPSDPRPSDARPSDPRPSDPRPSDPRPSDPRPSDARPAGPPSSDARPLFDPTIEPLVKVPGVAVRALSVSLSAARPGGGDAVLRIRLVIDNAGPGPAYALRGRIAAPRTPAIDGRILYVGRVHKGTTIHLPFEIALSAEAAAALRAGPLELAIELRDAHGTAPVTPVRFRGPVLADVSP